MSIHREGTVSIILTLLFIAAVNLTVWYFVCTPFWISIPLSVLSALLLAIILWFFRYPARSNEGDENTVICPCDGKVVVIEETTESEYFKDRRIQVSVFMSPLNVHINWYPVKGIVDYCKYHPGKHLVAWHPKSSTENERMTTVVKDPSGRKVLSRQIAGTLARRIVCYATEGKSVSQCDEMGFIKFGSRVDIFLPTGSEIMVELGQKTTGNKTVLARLK